MANRYMVAGRGAATAATANHVLAQFWNPHGTKACYVREVWGFKTVATADHLMLVRSTARGATPTSTVTPSLENAYDRRAAPPSAAVLELATFGTQPTVASTVPLARTNLPAAIAAGYIWVFPEAIEVPAGTGLCIATPVATVLQPEDLTVVWDE